MSTARTVRQAEVSGLALAVAAAALAEKEPDQARLVLAELERLEGVRGTPYYARQLPGMVRTALAAGDAELARRLVAGSEPRYPLEEHSLCTAHAQLAEHAREYVEAAALYTEAAERWKEFGNVPERAYALLGQGRCMVAVDQLGADSPLQEAHELFSSMRYKPAMSETDTLLKRAAAPTP